MNATTSIVHYECDLVSDEEAALYAHEMPVQQVIKLAGVTIHIGHHPTAGHSLVVFPMLGDHAILRNPFAGNDNSL